MLPALFFLVIKLLPEPSLQLVKMAEAENAMKIHYLYLVLKYL